MNEPFHCGEEFGLVQMQQEVQLSAAAVSRDQVHR